MYCKICGNTEIGIRLLGQNICKDCIKELTAISVLDECYDYYKNLIRILLGCYIPENYKLNPVS